jgi:hypothetical protein
MPAAEHKWFTQLPDDAKRRLIANPYSPVPAYLIVAAKRSACSWMKTRTCRTSSLPWSASSKDSRARILNTHGGCFPNYTAVPLRGSEI